MSCGVLVLALRLRPHRGEVLVLGRCVLLARQAHVGERGLKHGNRLSGDVAFCHWARELGYPIIVDTLQDFIHEGPARFAGMLARDVSAAQEQTGAPIQ